MANNELIRYWQSAAKLNLINQRILPRERLDCARFIPIAQIEKGWLDNWVGEQQEVYLAPFCFKEGADLSIPFWLEASLLPTGEILPRKPSALLWVLPAFLDSLSTKLPILGSIHAHDALMNDYFGTPDNPKVFANWAEYYALCIRFMSELHPNWKQEFIQTGFDLFDRAIVLPIAAMATLSPDINPLLKNYIDLDFLPSKSQEKIMAPILSQGLLEQGAEPWAKNTLLALAGLEPGECLAIEHDKDVPFQQFFSEWSHYLFVTCALSKRPLPRLAIISTKNSGFEFVLPAHFAFSPHQSNRTLGQFIDLFKQHFSADQFTASQLTPDYMSAYIHEFLELNDKQYQQGLSFIKAYRETLTQQETEFKTQSLEDRIQSLQTQDATLEDRYQSLLAAQSALSSEGAKGFLGQMWEKLGQSKAKHLVKHLDILAQHIVLDEAQTIEIKNSDNLAEWVGQNLRKIQVERTKLHAELVNLSEVLTERQGKWHRVLTWQKQHKLGLFSDKKPLNLPSDQVISAELNAHFGKLIFDCANLYWQAQQHLGAIFSCETVYQDPHEKFTYQDKVDYVFVLQANHFSPMLGSEFCAIGERIIGFAGARTLMAPILTPLQDTWLTRRHQLMQNNEESVLEETGALVSTGDAFQLISAHSVYEDSTYPGMGYPQAFYLDEPAGLYPNLQARIDFNPIVGQMVPDRGSFINSLEAQHLFNWIKTQIASPSEPLPEWHSMMVVTAFAAQQYYLESLLEGLEGICLPVYTLREAMGKRAKWVMVSMVNASEALGPSIYDQNPLLLPEIIRMAEQRLIVFADPGIFALSHTTLGKFANKVLARTPEQKHDIIHASSL